MLPPRITLLFYGMAQNYSSGYGIADCWVAVFLTSVKLVSVVFSTGRTILGSANPDQEIIGSRCVLFGDE